MDRFSDEPFGVRDIQFNRPKIVVEACTTSEEINHVLGTRRFGGFRRLPLIAAGEAEHALENGDVPTAAGHENEQRAALGIALPHYCREISGCGGTAQNAGDLDVRREPSVAQAASRSSAPISTAASASRLRAPRIFSSVAEWRVMRLIAASAFRCSAPASGGERRRKTRSTGRPSIAL